MGRRIATGAVVLTLAVPAAGGAKVDPGCPTMTSTSVVAGTVQNAKGQPLAGMTVEIYTTNATAPAQPGVQTDGQGGYRICAGSQNAAGHNTYDVRVRDLTAARAYATTSQPYTTFSNLSGDADFTPASGLPLLYATTLGITPNEISTVPGVRTPTGAVPVAFGVRSKAPATTAMKLKLGHRSNPLDPDGEFPMILEAAEPGGWNRWTHAETFAPQSDELLAFASVRGLDAGVVVTQVDRQPYVVDNTAPVFGFASTTVCGPGVQASPFSPGDPGTTNPQPIVTHGACDQYRSGTRSGLDPFSLRGWLCADAALASCEPINPVLSTFTITWLPPSPLALGDHFFRWRIADAAGNSVTNDVGFRLRVTDRGGQTPVLSGLQPANLGSGSSLGVVIGSSLTTPTSYPTIGFRATDADGQTDIVPGSLRVRVYYGDERTLVYDYDPFASPTAYDPITRRGGASFDLSSGSFRATGYPLQGKPPGRYLATASVNDHGGNAATVSWHWILAGAS